MPSSHLILCCPLLLLPPIPPGIRIFSNEVAKVLEFPHEVAKVLEFQPQHQSFQWTPRTDLLYLFFIFFVTVFHLLYAFFLFFFFRISFRMDWLDLLAVQGTLKSLLQHHSSKAPNLLCSAFFIVQLSHPYMTTRKTIALTRWTLVGCSGGRWEGGSGLGTPINFY